MREPANRTRELAVFAFYLCGAVTFTYPLVTGLDRWVTDRVDPLLNFWVSTCCGYYGVFTWIALGVVVPCEIARHSGSGARRKMLSLAGTLGLTALALVPLARPYFRLEREFGFSRPLPRLDPASARLDSYLRTSVAWHQEIGLRGGNAEQRLFPGVALSLLALAGLFTLDKRTLPFVILGGLAFWASLGPRAGLYGALHAVVPGVSGLRVPARWSILVFLAMAVLAAGALSRLARRASSGRFVALLPLLALVPLAELHRTRNYMLSSTIHFRPLLNGHSAFAPPSFYEAARALESFPDGKSLDLLEARGVGFVVLHKDRYLKPRARELAARVAAEPRLVSVFDSECDSVYRLKAR